MRLENSSCAICRGSTVPATIQTNSFIIFGIGGLCLFLLYGEKSVARRGHLSQAHAPACHLS